MLRLISGSARDLAPIVLVIAFFQLAVLRQPFPGLGGALAGLAMVLLGLALFVRGLDIGLFPLGESMAYAFARRGSIGWLLTFAFALGFGTTAAEPLCLHPRRGPHTQRLRKVGVDLRRHERPAELSDLRDDRVVERHRNGQAQPLELGQRLRKRSRNLRESSGGRERGQLRRCVKDVAQDSSRTAI